MKQQGLKYDEGKPDLSYISYEFLAEIAKAREFGEKKYTKYKPCNCNSTPNHSATCDSFIVLESGRGNWKKGFKVTRSLAAALRHIYLFLSGETYDKESGLSHLAHAACCLEHAIWDMKH